MKNEQKNMEDFLKEKLGHGEAGFTNDWPIFEHKLERALFFKQMRVGALVSVVLILLSIGFFGSSSFSKFNIFQKGNSERVEHYRGDGRFSDFNADKKSVHHTEAASKLAPHAKADQKLQAAQNNESVAAPDLVPLARVSKKDESHPKSTERKIGSTDVALSQKVDARNTAEQSFVSATVASSVVKSGGENGASKKVSTQSTVAGNASAKPKVLAMATDQVSSRKVETSGFGASKEAGESAAVSKKSRGVSSHDIAMMPDGLEASNYKLNTKPIELMVDLDDLNTMSVIAPVIPMKLLQAKKEVYVSPLQEKKPWSYSIKVYPNFTYRKFSVAANKMPYIHRDFIDQVKVSETGGFSLNVGFEASKRIGRITYLNFGVEYISYKTEANFDFMNYRDAVISPESGKITSYNFKNEAEHIVIVDANRYHYLNFPLSISYRPWATDHVRLNIEAGASYMYFIKATGKSIDYQTLEIIDLSDRDYRNSMASICLKVGASYHVSEQLSLGFEPTVVYFSNTIYTEKYPFEVVPYSVGVNFKLQMKLN